MSSSSEQEELQIDDASSDEDVASDEAAGSDDIEDDDESVAGESEPEESGEESAVIPALDESSTESDEDDEVADDDDVPEPAKAANPAQNIDKITQKITEKYQKRQGRQLYIRFPEKLPDSLEDFQAKVKSLSELVVIGHKPRQKHARFCLVDFASSEDRDKVLKKLQKTSAETKVVASLPLTDSVGFVKTLAEKKLKQIERKKAKLLLRKERRKAQSEKEFTSTIVVLNIPKSASAAQVKELFPDAVDMQIRGASSKFDGTSIATITLPSTTDAKKNFRRSLTLGGNKLIIRFNTTSKKTNKKQKNKATKNGDGKEEPKKGPIVPNANGKKKQKKNKNKNKANANGVKATEEQQVSSKKPKLPLSQKKATDDEPDSEVPQKVTSNKPKLPLSQKRGTDDQADGEVPQKKAKVVVPVDALQPKAKHPQKEKKGNQEGSNKFPQKKGNKGAKGVGQKPYQPNRQKQQKKGKKPVAK